MDRLEFKLPEVGEGVTEGEVVRWHVQPGQAVQEDDPMVEVMTDKATVTIGAPQSGKVEELRFGVGDTAQVGDVLIVLSVNGKAAPEPNAVSATRARRPREAPPVAPSPAVGAERALLPPRREMSPSPHRGDYFEPRPLATPTARKLARDLDVDLRRVPPSGQGGRVTKSDVRHFANGGISSPGGAPGRAVRDSPLGLRHERQPFVGIRRRIAERMQHAKNTAAHFTFVEECDATRLVELRDRLRASFREKAAVDLTYLPFVVRAVVVALEKYPILNTRLDEAANELVYQGDVHIGIATATEAGLVVPVVQHADRRSIVELAAEIDRLARAARAGTLTGPELTGSTFTVTSLGKHGGLLATPILNVPEVGILGIHKIKKKPVVRDGVIEIGDVMNVSLSFDHRIVDGHVGAAFAYEIIEYLEQPDQILIDFVH